MPLLTGPAGAPELSGAFYGDMTQVEDPAAIEALGDLMTALDRVCYRVPTRPGRLMIACNRLAMHRRAPFQPLWDGKDRWMQRVMVTDALWPLRTWQSHSNRVLDPRESRAPIHRIRRTGAAA